MSILKILLAEIGYRKLNFGLSLFAVVIAVTLFVAGPMLVEGYQRETQTQVGQLQDRVDESERLVAEMEGNMVEVEKETTAELLRLEDETRRLMRDMGFNLMIVHRDTDMSDFWASDFATHDMPQEYIQRLAQDTRLTMVTHLVATLQQRIAWESRKVLLVGYLPETTQSHMRRRSPMGYNIEPGTVFLGHELGAGRKPGETISVLGRDFRIARILPEQGSKQDVSIGMHLQDAQEVLEKPQRINQIMALGCHCAGANLPKIRQQLEEVLPETRVTEFRSIALARAEQRDLVKAKQEAILAEMAKNLEQRRQILAVRKELLNNMEASRARIQRIMETLADVITPLVVLASAIWVGLLALANVRQRRTEIGILRALGKGSGTIASLFLGKAVLLGILGALAGLLLGIGMARWMGARALDLGPDHFHVPYEVLMAALLGAPVLSAVASYLPTLTALTQDPAVVLRDQ